MSGHETRLLLIDGHSMAFRAFYALPVDSFATSGGQPTNAVYGFTSMLLTLLASQEPTHVGVAFDVSRHTFRTDLYGGYKATRGDTPEAFIGQVDLIKQVLDALGIGHCELADYEADDILATWTRHGRGDGMDVWVCSGDRDTYQLVDEHVTVLSPRQGVTSMNHMTPAAIQEKYGVAPAQYPDLAALVGEQSDNLPGVPGVGPKTAAKWLGQYGTLAGVVEHAGEIGGKVGEALRAHLDQVLLNRRLATPVTDLDLPLTPESMAPRGADRAALDRVFDALEFRALRTRALELPLLWAAGTAPGGTAGGQVPAPTVVTLAPGGLGGWLASRAGTRLGVDVTGMVAAGHGDAYTVALAGADGEGVVYDLATIGDADSAALEGYLGSANAPKALADAKSAWHMLADRGPNLAGVAFDTTLAAYLCYPDQRGYDLDGLARRLLGRGVDDEAEAGQGTLLDLPGTGEAAGHRAVARAVAVAQLVEPLERELEARAADGLLRELELPLTPILARMEAAGIGVDQEKLDELRDRFAERVRQAAEAAADAIGRDDVNLASPKQLQDILFHQLGFTPKRKTKTGYSTDAETLAELYAETHHPFLEHLLEHRDAIKLLQMVEGLRAAVADDGRIHTTFQQAVAATGRLSSADPNLQNIPIRTPAGREIRDVFTVGDGYEALMTADYSQIEMRVMAHLSGDRGLIDAFRSGEDLHRAVAAMVFGVPASQVTAQQRSRIKAMSYGLAYGLSTYGLSKQLGIAPHEATALMDAYYERFGGIKQYLAGVVERARRTGYTETIMGRRRYLPGLTSDVRQTREAAERMALNAPIQGSAADIVKRAMLGVDRALADGNLNSRVLLQVHDELVVEVAPGEAGRVERLLREQMGGAMKLSVPLDVSVGVGRTWAQAAH